jgi:uncharacterized membrane protein YgdD (TMEM256/DUF423 family)
MPPNFFRFLIAIAALSLAEATVLGAIGSHLLGSRLDADALSTFGTGVDYQFIHSLGLLAIAIYGDRYAGTRLLGIAALLLLAGILLFCSGVYVSSIGGPEWIAGLAPAGGVSLIAGWVVVAIAVLQPILVRRKT